MSTKYKATETDTAYFITITTVEWIDVFTRLNQKYAIINSLDYCQKHKELEIYAYCLMSNHLHLLCKGINGVLLSDIMKDFKKFTEKKIIENILNEPESRKEWMLPLFKKACDHLKRDQTYKVWQNGYHAEVTTSNWFIKQKLNYIHQNPVVEKIVAYPEDYYFSSARNYASLSYPLQVEVLNIF
ncbi:REP-associated tyrosine transposase [Gangjinia marincola]